MKRILIDTDILIDAGHKVKTAVNYLDFIKGKMKPCLSVVSEMELIVGCENKSELRKLKKFLRHFEVIHFHHEISYEAVDLLEKYRLSHGLLMPDAFIAATALIEELEFVSKNQKDFRFIKNLNLIAYPPIQEELIGNDG